jgi:hypothetical protein
VVADHEADIYPAWGSVPQANFHVLTRAMSHRSLAGGGTLFSASAAACHQSCGCGWLHWRRLTTHQIADAAGAWQIVG